MGQPTARQKLAEVHKAMTPDEIAEHALVLAEDAEDVEDVEERYCIGGCIDRVTITRGSIVCDVVRRWPEDKVGEMITLGKDRP